MSTAKRKTKIDRHRSRGFRERAEAFERACRAVRKVAQKIETEEGFKADPKRQSPRELRIARMMREIVSDFPEKAVVLRKVARNEAPR